MNCKNCGAKLKETARVCPNCGAFVDDSSGYTLLTADDRIEDFYSSDGKAKKKGSLAFVISLILTVAIIGAGAYYYFENIKPRKAETPPVTFSSGSGIINDDEPVIYVAIEKNADIQYIHGVSLYKADYSESGIPKNAVSVSSDYEYTKNVDDTFRAIFFDTEKLDLKKNEVYSFTFEIKMSFKNSDDVFTYVQKAEISGDIKDDASDIVFDHTTSGQSESDNSETTEKPTEKSEEETTKAEEKTADNSFIYESYWYNKPYDDGELKTIIALKFNEDNTFVSTKYEKNGDADFVVSTENGTFKIENGEIVISNGQGTENTKYKIGNNTLTEEQNGETVQTLTARKYNSVKNAEDFFGI